MKKGRMLKDLKRSIDGLSQSIHSLDGNIQTYNKNLEKKREEETERQNMLNPFFGGPQTRPAPPWAGENREESSGPRWGEFPSLPGGGPMGTGPFGDGQTGGGPFGGGPMGGGLFGSGPMGGPFGGGPPTQNNNSQPDTGGGVGDLLKNFDLKNIDMNMIMKIMNDPKFKDLVSSLLK